jgi:hypothetical protein
VELAQKRECTRFRLILLLHDIFLFLRLAGFLALLAIHLPLQHRQLIRRLKSDEARLVVAGGAEEDEGYYFVRDGSVSVCGARRNHLPQRVGFPRRF